MGRAVLPRFSTETLEREIDTNWLNSVRWDLRFGPNPGIVPVPAKVALKLAILSTQKMAVASQQTNSEHGVCAIGACTRRPFEQKLAHPVFTHDPME